MIRNKYMIRNNSVRKIYDELAKQYLSNKDDIINYRSKFIPEFILNEYPEITIPKLQIESQVKKRFESYKD
jgi:hypothetical protein